MRDITKHTISVLVTNRPGVLIRVAGLFSRRGFNIDSLAVGTTQDPAYSRISLVVHGDDRTVEQVTKQLNKLIDVIKVSDITNVENVDRELVLMKIMCPPEKRAEIMSIAGTFRAGIVDIADGSIILEVTGVDSKLIALENLMRQYGLIEIVRTGKVSLVRGSQKT